MRIKDKLTVIMLALIFVTMTIIGFVSAIGGIHRPGELSFSQGLSDGTKPPQKYSVEAVVTVDRGDTLWNIMRGHYGNDVHGQKGVYRIRGFNDMSPDQHLQPNMEIKLPRIE